MGPMSKCYNTLRLKKLVRDKHSSLLGTFVNYGENEMLLMRPPCLTVGSDKLPNTRLERLVRDKHSSLLGPSVSYGENAV